MALLRRDFFERVGRPARSGALPAGTISLPKRLDWFETRESLGRPLPELGRSGFPLPGNQAAEESAVAQQPGVAFAPVIQHFEAELFMRNDVVEGTEAILDVFGRVVQFLPSVFRLLGGKNACHGLRRITEFFHCNPQLVPLRGVEPVERPGFLQDLLAPASQLFGRVTFDRGFPDRPRGDVFGIVRLVGLDPGGELDQQLPVSIRPDDVGGVGEGRVAFARELPPQGVERGVAPVSSAEWREHLRDVDVGEM